MSTLKPCPFCGEKNDVHIAWYHYDDIGSKAVVECRNCFCSSGYYKNVDEAIKAWNKRTKAPELKPCPFCGGAATLRHYDDEVTMFYIECSMCHCSSVSSCDAEDVINDWNNRSNN